MRRLLVPTACVLLASASAGASGARPPVALTASPPRVALTGSGLATITVANPGRSPVVVDVSRAGFTLDLRGRPRIRPGGGARSWIALRPRRLALGAGERASLDIRARVPAGAEPGDHDALVLLTTRPQPGSGVAVRMRIGVVVVVRAPGRIVHRLEIRGLRVRRVGHVRMLDLLVVNRGDVTEKVDHMRLELVRRGVTVRVAPRPREVRPRSRGIVQYVYRGPLHGRLTARVGHRTFRIRL